MGALLSLQSSPSYAESDFQARNSKSQQRDSRGRTGNWGVCPRHGDRNDRASNFRDGSEDFRNVWNQSETSLTGDGGECAGRKANSRERGRNGRGERWRELRNG